MALVSMLLVAGLGVFLLNKQASRPREEKRFAVVPYEMPESVSAKIAQILEEEDVALLYALPQYEMDGEEGVYRPEKNEYYDSYCWFIAVLAKGERKLYYYYEKYDTLVDGTDLPGMTFDESLGTALVERARAAGCEPLFFVFIGQRWLLSRAADGALYACGYTYTRASGEELQWVTETEFLQGIDRYIEKVGPSVTGGVHWMGGG